MSPAQAFFGVFWPAVGAMAVLLIGLALRRWRSAGPIAGAGAIAIGFVIADLYVRGMPPLAPTEATRWLPHAALVLSAAAILRALGGAFWQTAAIGVAIGIATLLILGPGMNWREGSGNATATLLIAAAMITTLYILGGAAARGPDAILSPSIYALLSFSAGIALAQSHFASVGQILTGLCGAFLALLVMSAWWPRMGILAGGLPVGAALFALCIVTGRIYSDVPMPSALLLLGGATIPLLLRAPRLRSLPFPVRAALGLSAAAVLSAAAIWLTPNQFDFSG